MGKNDLSRIESAMAVLYVTGQNSAGDVLKVDLEELSISCFKAFPQQFAYDCNKQYPRYDRVVKNISKVIKSGIARYLNQKKTIVALKMKEAKKWADEHSELVRAAADALMIENQIFQGIGQAEALKELEKLRRSTATKAHKAKTPLTLGDYMDFLNIDTYVTENVFRRKLRYITTVCQKDQEMDKLLNIMKISFGDDYTKFKISLENVLRCQAR